MFGFLFNSLTRKRAHSLPGFQIPAGIPDSYYQESGAIIEGVFQPHVAFRSAVAEGVDQPRAFPEQILITPLGQHLKLADIERDLSVLGMSADHPLVEALTEVTAGDGIDLASRAGRHERATTFMVVDAADPLRWYALFRLERSISYQNNELVYGLESMMSYIKPAYAVHEQDFLYCAHLAGSVIANEIERMAFGHKDDFPTVTFRINMSAPENDAWISFAQQIAQSVGDYLAQVED